MGIEIGLNNMENSMNREIKFRVWDGLRLWQPGEWEGHHGFILNTDGRIYAVHAPDPGLDELHWYPDWDDESVLLQYTGLKDSEEQGTDIYEGDYIDINGKIAGNIYEHHALYERGTHLLITGMGTSAWRATEQEGLGRGCRYTEQPSLSSAFRELG